MLELQWFFPLNYSRRSFSPFPLDFSIILSTTIYLQTGGSRKEVVIEEKRAVVASNEEKFQAQVFKMTTDEDMPAYSGFEFTA